MANQEAHTGIAAVGPVPWGAHFCQLYDTVQDMVDVLVPYFRTGLEHNELCHWVTSEHFSAEDARTALGAAYPGLDQAIARGQITILDRRQWYQRNGRFRAEEVVQGWLAHEAEARSSGYAGYRLTGDTLWLEKHDWHEFIEYERLVTEAFGSRRMIALCTYCMGRCGASEVLDIVGTHAFAVARRRGEWHLVESPAIKTAKAELAELNATLAARVDAATAELRELVAYKDALLREVHHRVKNNLQIVSNLLAMKSRGAPEQARRVLAETADRVHAIGAVHEALYETHDARIHLVQRLRTIMERMLASYELQGRVEMDVSGDDLDIPLEGAVAVALIATEMASNAFKHAFPGDRRGRVAVRVAVRPDGWFELDIADDGIGWTPEAARRGSGLAIALALARQVKGRLELDARPGAGVR
ncbi:MAG TPA: MEDS domain-containing protein, partial [Pseudoxanthomonas sp.]|nr:MEDS domain-containing protein [Pseudoxanthomonas sp.]